MKLPPLVTLRSYIFSSIAHEITSAIFRFKREGLLETVGPAGKTSARLYLHWAKDHFYGQGANAMSGLRVTLIC